MKISPRPPIPIIDLFAGPGGLGEGFSAFEASDRKRPFDIALSVEKDDAAHQTLVLRTLYRLFPPGQVPPAYYEYLRADKSTPKLAKVAREKLFQELKPQSDKAQEIAWKAELGKVDANEVDRRITHAIGGAKDWVLCGGPPCQAYSIMGRSRNGGIDPSDPKVYLYREYLRILAKHNPPVFIMENVKGLLSSKVGAYGIFGHMLEDLRDPGALVGDISSPTYSLYSLVAAPSAWSLDGEPVFETGDFVIKAEEYGIPQCRHRVIILGIRKEIAGMVVPRLHRRSVPIRADRVLRGLPRVRSGLTKDIEGNPTQV